MAVSAKTLPNYDIIRHFAARYPSLDISAIETCALLRLIAGEMVVAFDAHFARHNLSKSRFMVLLTLLRYEDRSVSPAELADYAGVTRATITGLLDTLESTGHITREQNPDDRRALAVKLTPEGRAFLDQMLPDHYQRIAALMADFTASEREQLITLLEKVAAKISKIKDP